MKNRIPELPEVPAVEQTPSVKKLIDLIYKLYEEIEALKKENLLLKDELARSKKVRSSLK